MGFLDKLKGTAQQAVKPGAMAGERDKIMRINKTGVQRYDATLQGIAEGGNIIVKVDPQDPQALLIWGASS